LPHIKKKEWQGIFRLTAEGEKRLKAELVELLSFKKLDQSLKKIQPLIR